LGAFVGLAVVAFAAPSNAQAQATIRGTVTDATGQPVSGVEVRVEEDLSFPAVGPRQARVAAMTGDDGTFELLVPAARMNATGETRVILFARRIGLRAQSVVLSLMPDASLTQDFTLAADPFLLEEVVVTGQGLTESRQRLGTTISTVRAEDVIDSRETNVVAAMAGKAPNVEVTKSAGDPGSGTYIRIRGSKSIEGGTQPLIVVDGQPINNSSRTVEGTTAGTVYQNRAADLNPHDVESVEILKGAAAGAIYGSRAASGVVLITTKSGRPNQSRVTVSSSYAVDKVNIRVPLQRQFRLGTDQAAVGGSGNNPAGVRSWGTPLDAGEPSYDHWGELFGTGHQWDNTVSLAGGTDRTTYYLSLGYLDHNGVIQGNSAYERITARLKGSHDFLSNLTVGGNFAFTTSNADLIQTGSNISGLLLGGLRTPPEFNNLPYLDPVTGLHRSYRNPDATTVSESRGFDNPFWIANEILNTSEVDRVFGNITLDYQPFNWLNVSWLLGGDFANDQRLTQFPKGSSDFPTGRLIRGELVEKQWDHSLLVTVNRTLTPDVAWSLTLGQNLNQTQFRRYQVNGFNLIFGTDQLDFTIDREPNEFISTVRTDGYFGQATIDLYDQVFLAGSLRWDGSNTFGGEVNPETGNRESNRFLYPKASLAWDFSQYVDFLDFGKVRVAYGETGKQPPIYSNVSAFQTATLTDGWLSPNGLNTIYQGFDGVVSQGTLGNASIEPEKTKEIEAGGDFTFLDSRVNLGVTYYRDRTEAAIVQLPIAPTTGFNEIFENGASWRNWGWELTLDVLPIQTSNFTWKIGGQWATNNSTVDTLLGAEEISLTGFTGGTASIVQGQPFPVLYGRDFVRFGRGIIQGGVDIDEAYPNAPRCAPDAGRCSDATIYIGADGFPRLDPQDRVLADLSPEWTASFRNTFTLFGKVRVSSLFDIKHGGFTWNGTKGALVSYGTHGVTIPWHGEGQDHVFPGDGPGAGQQVKLNWSTWGQNGLGSGFNGPRSQFIEPSGFVKLRDVSVSFTVDAPWVRTIGFNSFDVTVSGRNLKTWTDYGGIDPESNLNGQTTGRGLEYFNHPQTRSFVFALSLHR
jgi:TonB-linked SusC/RagA family outer membrane protein